MKKQITHYKNQRNQLEDQKHKNLLLEKKIERGRAIINKNLMFLLTT